MSFLHIFIPSTSFIPSTLYLKSTSLGHDHFRVDGGRAFCWAHVWGGRSAFLSPTGLEDSDPCWLLFRGCPCFPPIASPLSCFLRQTRLRETPLSLHSSLSTAGAENSCQWTAAGGRGWATGKTQWHQRIKTALDISLVQCLPWLHDSQENLLTLNWHLPHLLKKLCHLPTEFLTVDVAEHIFISSFNLFLYFFHLLWISLLNLDSWLDSCANFWQEYS